MAEALGINVPAYKLLAFIISSTMTSVAGALFSYYRGFVSAEAFSLFLTIQYVAMVIIGGMGSMLGAVLGAVFVTLFPYLIEWLMARAADAGGVGHVRLRRQLRGLRPGHDPLPALRAAGVGRHLAARPGLLPAVAVPTANARATTA